jgi:hypothetical protein
MVPPKRFSESGKAMGSGALAGTMRAEGFPLGVMYEAKTGEEFKEKDCVMKGFEEQRKSQKQ